MKKIIYTLLSLILVSIMLAGCPTPPVPPPPPGTTAPIPGTTTPTPGTVTPPSTTKPGGGTLNLYGIDPTTLDPALSGDASSNNYVLQIFSGLLKLDASLNPVADIAKTWDISPDGKTYTFHLDPNARFQDGKPVKASDFKFSFERACNPQTRSTTAGSYLNDIVGAKEMLTGKAKDLSGVKAIDNNTLQITIDAPKSYFLAKMTYPTSFVTDQANVSSGSNWWLKPNGSGPFRLSQWTKSKSLVLARNSNYYGRIADLDIVSFHLFAGVPMDLYETNQIDATSISLAYLFRAQDKSGPFATQLTETPELSMGYMGFNCSKPPFDDANIRRAFAMAIDKTKIVSLVYMDAVKKADGILPPGIPGYNADIKGIKYDVEGAKALIKQSKYGDASKLPPIVVTIGGLGGGISNDLQAAIYQWQQNLSVTITVRQLEPDLIPYQLKANEDEMFSVGGWIADYPHPQDFLDVLFRTGNDSNWGSYSNPALDKLLDQANTELDSTKSIALYRQAEQMIVDDAAVIPLTFGRNYNLVKPYVKGYKTNALGFVNLNEVSILPH